MGHSDYGQCPKCGRCSEDWADSRSKKVAQNGAKDIQTKTIRDKLVGYRKWHRTLGRAILCSDIDSFEYRRRGNREIHYVGKLELSEVPGDLPLPFKYCDNVRKRFMERDCQGEIIVDLARRTGCKAWIVLFRDNLAEFWLYNMTDDEGWWHLTEPEYAAWVSGMEVFQNPVKAKAFGNNNIRPEDL